MRPIYNDELYHYGIKGMHWGKRIANYTKESIGVRAQAHKDMLLHPIQSTKAQLTVLRNNPLGSLTGSTNAFKQINTEVKNRVNTITKKNNKIKEYEQQINAGVSTVERIFNNVTGVSRRQAEMMYNKKYSKTY